MAQLPLPRSASAPALHAGPAAGTEAPFELLAACHERLQRSLGLLQRLLNHVAQLPGQMPDEQATRAAVDVMRYFDVAAPLHHEDEERHIIPALQASDDPQLMAAAQQMLADHAQFRAVWLTLRAGLADLAASRSPAGMAALMATSDAFITLHHSHLGLEDGLVFPAAQTRLTAAELAVMSTDMGRRRGLG
ncbi:hemerythrin domain-containing protein [Ideonella margarita]|uniref:Hemerythrin domain-containing protein n=1 Tax=Ideonella margarita TaxID=2984191 RepID=A0ABU9C781_9BURK